MILKDDVPFINIIELGYSYKEICGDLYCVKQYNGDKVYINTKTRKIELYHNGIFRKISKYEHCIKDLMQKQYIK